MDGSNEFEKYKKRIEKSLIKKALGYNYNEVIEEFAVDEDGEKLTKRKVTIKNVPPDISAVKMLLDLLNLNSNVKYAELTDEELKKEIKNAVEILENNYKRSENGTKKS